MPHTDTLCPTNTPCPTGKNLICALMSNPRAHVGHNYFLPWMYVKKCPTQQVCFDLNSYRKKILWSIPLLCLEKGKEVMWWKPDCCIVWNCHNSILPCHAVNRWLVKCARNKYRLVCGNISLACLHVESTPHRPGDVMVVVMEFYISETANITPGCYVQDGIVQG